MSGQALAEMDDVIRDEVRAVLVNDMKEIYRLRDFLESALAKQEQLTEEFKTFVIGNISNQKTDYQAHFEAMRGLFAEQKKLAEETRTIYQDTSNHTHELRRIATKHQERVSAYYYNLHLRVFGIAALGGFFALLMFQITYRFIIPFFQRFF